MTVNETIEHFKDQLDIFSPDSDHWKAMAMAITTMENHISWHTPKDISASYVDMGSGYTHVTYTCPRCGEIVSEDDNYCSSCSQKLRRIDDDNTGNQ